MLKQPTGTSSSSSSSGSDSMAVASAEMSVSGTKVTWGAASVSGVVGGDTGN